MQREHRLDGAGGRQRVADHRLVRRDRDRAHALAEHGRQRQMLHLVVFRRRGAVGVDIVDLVLADAGIGKRGADRRDRRRAVRLGAGAVEIVGLLAAAARGCRGSSAPRARRRLERFQHQRRRRLRRARSRRGRCENGFEAFSGRSLLGRQRRQQREADQRLGGAEPSAPIESARSHSPRRIASTPSWIAVAPEAQAVDSVIGRPRVPKRSASRSAIVAELGGLEDLVRVQPARHRKQPLSSPRPRSSDCVEREAVASSRARPAARRGTAARRNRLSSRPASATRLVRCGLGQLVGEGGGALAARRQEVDRAGDAGVQVVDRKAGDRVDAGAAGRQGRPIVGLADAERGDDADAGYRDDRPAEMVLRWRWS